MKVIFILNVDYSKLMLTPQKNYYGLQKTEEIEQLKVLESNYCNLLN